MRAGRIGPDTHREARTLRYATACRGREGYGYVQLELGDAVAPQVPPVTAKSFALLPLKLSFKGSGNPDRFVTVTFLVFDGALAVSVPYASALGATVAGIVVPVLSVAACGLEESGLSETDSDADSVPRAPGVKVTTIVQAPLAPSVEVQAPPVTAKSAALVPLMLSLSEIATV